MRPMRAEDGPVLVDVFEHMSPQSRYMRFQQTVDHVSKQRIEEEAHRIVLADLAKNHGLIAYADLPHQVDVPVGVARWVEINADEAEVAISVRDDFQNQGIGSQLMQYLVKEAAEAGYKRLSASILNANPAIWSVFAHLPYVVIRTPVKNGSEVIIALNAPRYPDEELFAQDLHLH